MQTETDSKTVDRLIVELKEEHSGESSTLEILSRMLLRLADIPAGEDVYRILCDALYELVPESVISIASFNKETGLFHVKAFRCTSKYIDNLTKILGKYPVGMSFIIDSAARQGLSSGLLEKVPGGLYELTMGNIPKTACTAIEKLLEIIEVYAIGLIRHDQLLGSVSFLMQRGHRAVHPDLIEKFIKLASIALQRCNAEDALIKSERFNKELLQRYSEVLETSSDMVFALDKDGNIKYTNSAYKKHLGYTDKDRRHIKCIQLIHPDDLDHIKRDFAAIFNGKSTQNHEYRYRRKDGSYITVLNSYCPVRDTEGNIISALCISRNISERKKMEEELREHKNNLEKLIEKRAGELRIINKRLQHELHEREHAEEETRQARQQLENLMMTSPVVMCRSDFKARVLYVNKKFEEVTGYTKEEVIGKYWPALGMTPDDTGVLLKRMMHKILGKPAVPMEVTIKCKDGQLKHISGIGEVIKRKGVPVGFQVIAQDITERKKAEECAEKSTQQLLKALEDIVETMAITVELRDPYTAGHQRRVAQLAHALAGDMGLSEDQQTGVRFAGLIHDIGKIRVPTEILTHPDVLGEVEMKIIRTHPVTGYEILKHIEFPWPIALSVLQHHERIDGSGYPSGIEEDDIIIEAKVLAVADVVEAMASHRPYRPSLGIDKALDEIKSNSGKLYHPTAVNSCVRLFKKKGFTFKEIEETHF